LRSTAARETLLRALAAGDRATAEALIAPSAMVLLPDGRRAEGRTAVLAGLSSTLPPPQTYLPSFDLARTRSCTGALQDLGMLLLRSREGGGSPAGLHATLLWRATGAQGGLQLHAAGLYRAGDYTPYRSRPCAPPGDSAFHARRTTVVIVPGPAVFSGDAHARDLAGQLRRTGWRPPLEEGYDPVFGEIVGFPADSGHEARRLPIAALLARRDLGGGLFLAVRGEGLNSGIERNDAVQERRVRLEYLTLRGAAQAGYTRGWLHVAAGPAALYTSGSWRTESSFGDAVPLAEQAWSASTLGLAADAGLLIPLSRRVGLDLAGFYRSFPDVDIAGYGGSEAMSVSFGEQGVSAGLAVRF
jgi:hypothetical protein